MRVSVPSEMLLNDVVAENEVGNLLMRDVMVSRKPVDEGGFDYSLTFKGGSLDPIMSFAVMREAAPYDGRFETPRGVIEDWQEPDNHSAEAKERIRRHEKMLGQDWHDFMRSRIVFMELLEAVPKLEMNEQEVRRLTNPDELAGFAAAYILNKDGAEVALKILQNAGVDDKHRTAIWDTIRRFIVSKPRDWYSSGNYHSLGDYANTQAAADAVKQCLIDLPNSVTKKIVDSTVRPVPVLDAFGHKQFDHINGGYKEALITPTSLFGEKYCVQAIRGDDGEVKAVPYARQGYTSRSDLWLIPEYDGFREVESNGTVRKSAVVVNLDYSDYNYAYRRMHFANRVVQKGSMRTSLISPLLKPEIRWRTSADGTEREFNLEDHATEVRGRRIVQSGMFGVILAAAAQPEIAKSWPDRKFGQIMGVAQLPVLALMRRQELLDGGLLSRAEELVAITKK